MAKRGNGEGNITHHATKDLWMARLTLADGSRKTLYGKTRQEAAQKLTAALRDRDNGVPQRTNERLTVKDFLDQWLDNRQPPKLSPSTWTRYKNLAKQANNSIGQEQLSRVTPVMLERLYAHLQRECKLSSSTAHRVHTFLHGAFDTAERQNLIARNPTDLVDAPRDAESEIHPYDPDQVRILLNAARGNRWEALYTVALSTGMREGELLGLHWADIDLDDGHIQVRYNLSNISGQGFRVGKPKTKSSRRKIDISPDIVEVLRKHKIAQCEQRLKSGPLWDDKSFPDLVFSNERGKPMSSRNLVQRDFHPLLKRAGLPIIRFHDLRHTAATLMLLEGVPIKVVSERLGHASTTITQDLYSHVLPTMQREASTALDHILFG